MISSPATHFLCHYYRPPLVSYALVHHRLLDEVGNRRMIMSDVVVQVYGMDWNGWMPGWCEEKSALGKLSFKRTRI